MGNSSDTTLIINWEITNIVIPIEWGLGVGDKDISYHPGPPFTTNNGSPLSLYAGETNNMFNIAVYPHQISGCGSFDVLITLDETGFVLDTIEYKISINDDDCLISAINNPFYDEKIKLFPNPFVDHLEISTESTIKHVTIYNSNGNALDTQLTNIHNLKVSNLERGIYFIEIVSDKGRRAIKKVIKEK